MNKKRLCLANTLSSIDTTKVVWLTATFTSLLMFKASLEYPLEQDLFNQSFAVPICLKVLQNDIVRDEDSLLPRTFNVKVLIFWTIFLKTILKIAVLTISVTYLVNGGQIHIRQFDK